MRRLFASVTALLLLAGLFVPVAGVAAAPQPPKVVFVVGPTGYLTDRFRTEAEAAAAVARRFTPDVTEIYSPNATWPVVREAIQGASLVVYMGHGNGWPSKYRNELFPPTQNGFGLNPTAGGDDERHQYFGEASIGGQVKLAKNAVVLLHHLCYASGNSEPGLVEGTLAQARQRVDNFAAGFIRAGAKAVIAEAYASPSHFVRSILDGDRAIDTIWRTAPTAYRNVSAFKSTRSPGYVAQMDTETASSGFHRSIVLKAGLAARDVLSGGQGRAVAPAPDGTDPGPVTPSLVDLGVTLSAPDIRGVTTAGTKATLLLPYTIEDRKKLPDKLLISVRWSPVEIRPVPLDPTAEVTAEGTEGAEPSATPSDTTPSDTTPVTSPVPAASSDPAAPAEPLLPAAPPTEFDLVQPEQEGTLVEARATKVTKKYFSLAVRLPAAAGLYRLEVMLHDADGVAYDAATQALVPAVHARVVGKVDARVLATPSATLEAASRVPLDLRVANLGRAAWGYGAVESRFDPEVGLPASARVVGHWVALGGEATNLPGAVSTALPAGLRAGVTADVTLPLRVPEEPGEYLLVLDLVTPEQGSLASMGVAPTLVRITVVEAAAPG